MVQINFAAREINCKVVYYGPGRSGKTTNLEQVHANSPKKCVGEMVSIATETDRTLFFDFLPLDIGKVAGMQVRFQLYTVPGQVYYNATRKLVLQGVDGVIFVADSQRSMLEENIESLNNLRDNLVENGYDPDTVPLVLQWNKNDLPDLLPISELEEKLNEKGCPSNTGVASEGKGVFETLKKIAVLVLDKLNKEYGGGTKDKVEKDESGQTVAKPVTTQERKSAVPDVPARKLQPSSAPNTPAPAKTPPPQPMKMSSSPKKASFNKKPTPVKQVKSTASKEKRMVTWIVVSTAILLIAALITLVILMVL